MPKTRKSASRSPKAKTIGGLTTELIAVKAEVEVLHEKYTRLNHLLLRLCCPKEWFEDEIDDEQVWSKAVWEPSLSEFIASLK